jgi:hypothetical protein
VAKVERKAAVGLLLGKNCSDKITARLPKIKKSYHSISVPTDEAIITDHNLFFSVCDWGITFLCFDGKKIKTLTLIYQVRIKN